MKNNRGITLTSLVIYVIVLMIVIALLSNLSGYFFNNINQITKNEASEEQYLRLTSFITKDINSDNLIFVKDGTEVGKQYLMFKFKDGTTHQYIYYNKTIYYLNIINEQTTKKIELCTGVTGDNVFEFRENKINLNFRVNNKNYISTFNVNI